MPPKRKSGRSRLAVRAADAAATRRRPRPPASTISLTPYQPRSIALTLQPAWDAAAAFEQARAAAAAAAAANGRGGRGGGRGRGGFAPPAVPAPRPRATATVALPFNLDGMSTNALRGDGDFDGKQHTLAAELVPQTLTLDGVPFAFGSGQPGAKNVLVPAGQTLTLPAGTFSRVYVLAAAIGGDVPATIDVGATTHSVLVREWQGPVGQWWSRLTDIAPSLHKPFAVANGGGPDSGLVVSYDPRTGAVSGIDKIRPAFLKRDEIAWVGTHRHDPTSDEPYVSSYVFAYAFDLPAGTHAIRLPANDRIRVLAVSVAGDGPRATPAGPLYLPDFPDGSVATAIAAIKK